MNEGLAGQYPFLSSARALLGSVPGGAFLSPAWLGKARENVLGVLAADSRSASGPSRSSTDAGEAVAVYALSKLLLFAADSPYAWRRFARQYAKRVSARLGQRPADLEPVARDLLPSLRAEDEGFSVSVADFARVSSLPLSLQNVSGGRVRVPRDELVSFVEEGVAKRVLEPPASRAVPDAVKHVAAALVRELPREPLPVNAGGAFLQRACVQRILNGVPEGKRYHGSVALAIACYQDGLPKDAAVGVMKQYVENCAKGSSPFTLREAQATLDWVYRRGVKWSSRALVDQGLEPEYCESCPYRRKTRDRTP